MNYPFAGVEHHNEPNYKLRLERDRQSAQWRKQEPSAYSCVKTNILE